MKFWGTRFTVVHPPSQVESTMEGARVFPGGAGQTLAILPHPTSLAFLPLGQLLYRLSFPQMRPCPLGLESSSLHLQEVPFRWFGCPLSLASLYCLGVYWLFLCLPY